MSKLQKELALLDSGQLMVLYRRLFGREDPLWDAVTAELDSRGQKLEAALRALDK